MRHYRPIPTTDWQRFVGPDWRGGCVLCGRSLDAACFARQELVAIDAGESIHALCVAHVLAGGDEYERGVRALATAVAGLQRTDHGQGDGGALPP